MKILLFGLSKRRRLGIVSKSNDPPYKFYKEIFNRQISLKHLYPKRKEHKLPKFLTREEMKQVLDATENLKHKAILTTIYSCGLRLSKVLKLQISYIKTKDHLLLIRQSKGNKDRFLRFYNQVVNQLFK